MAEKHPFDDFGINLFSECVMKECLPHPIYKKWKTATRKEDALDRPTADCACNEDMGNGQGSDAFYALVPAADRLHCRKA